MKTVFRLILIVTTMAFLNNHNSYAHCDATWTSTIITQGCPYLYKEQTWTIYWADGNFEQQFNEGFGQCCGVFTPTECWPVFDSPVQFPSQISGHEFREWRQTVYDRRCNMGNCSNASGPKTVVTTHSCSQSCSNTGAMYQCFQNGYDWDFDSCTCSGGCDPIVGCSPIVIDTAGDGFAFTDTVGGVSFDLSADGNPEQIGWTQPGVDDALLTLDRNGNGTVDNGSELFGNFTPQPSAPANERNGFRALGVYDRPARGGNNDGMIDGGDAIFSSLRLWQDLNYNAISEANELRTLTSVGVVKIDLDYRESRRTDQYGNRFRFRSRVRDAQGAQIGRWAWDVFFVSAP